jgi:hypothetical protein
LNLDLNIAYMIKIELIIMNINGNKVELIKSKNLMKYQMKNNVRVYSNNLKLMITTYNCTDAIAEATEVVE